jgi:hypothetical protein
MKNIGITDKNFGIQIDGNEIHLSMLGRTVGMSAEDAVHIGTALLQYAGTVYGNRFEVTTPPRPNCEPGDKEGKEA